MSEMNFISLVIHGNIHGINLDNVIKVLFFDDTSVTFYYNDGHQDTFSDLSENLYGKISNFITEISCETFIDDE